MSEQPHPTGQELEILKVVWELQPATVRQVYEVLREERRIAYTTVMTMMGILERKGHLERHKEGRAYVYRPAVPKRQVISNMVKDFVNRVFDGSAKPLLVSLMEDRQLSEEDLEVAARLIRESEP